MRNKSLIRWNNFLEEKHSGEFINRVVLAQEMSNHGVRPSTVNNFLDCADKMISYACDSCGKIKHTPFSCKNRLCSFCAKSREYNLKRQYWPGIKHMKRAKLVTLTVGFMPVLKGEILSYHRQIVYNFRRKLEKTYDIRSGLIVTEISKELFLHFHIIIDSPHFMPQAKLSELWEKISGRYIVDIRAINGRKALNYVLKYVTKVPEFDRSDLYVKYYLLVKNRRLVSGIGSMYGVKREAYVATCDCGGFFIFLGISVMTPEDREEIFKELIVSY